MAALPLQIYKYATSPFPEWHRQAWAASLVLLGLVLLVSLTARFVIRSPYQSS
jgi:phosphate transport system permease protein